MPVREKGGEKRYRLRWPPSHRLNHFFHSLALTDSSPGNDLTPPNPCPSPYRAFSVSMRMVAYFDVHRRWLVTLATILLALLILSQGGQSSPADVSGPSPIARKRAPAAGKRPKGAKPLSRPAGRRPTLPVPERRKDEVKIGGSKTAAPAAAQVEVEEVEEGLLEEAMRERSINKYFSADPLWTGQLIASGMAWFLVVRGDTEVGF